MKTSVPDDASRRTRTVAAGRRGSVLESIETMLHAIEDGGAMDVAHPRYYNIAWMTLLEEAHSAMRGFNSVF